MTAHDAFDDIEPIDLGEDVDEIAVERRMRGDHTVPLNRSEAAEAFARLNARGWSAQEIGDALGVADRTVVRWRSGEARPLSLRATGPFDGWTWERVLAAHATWERHRRRHLPIPAEVREGQRIYDRIRTRQRRAAAREQVAS